MAMVGKPGFEPGTPCSQSKCASQAALHPEIECLDFYHTLGRTSVAPRYMSGYASTFPVDRTGPFIPEPRKVSGAAFNRENTPGMIGRLAGLVNAAEPIQAIPEKMVEHTGLEPVTSCLQSRCSSQLSQCPVYSIFGARPRSRTLKPLAYDLEIVLPQYSGSVFRNLLPFPGDPCINLFLVGDEGLEPTTPAV